MFTTIKQEKIKSFQKLRKIIPNNSFILMRYHKSL